MHATARPQSNAPQWTHGPRTSGRPVPATRSRSPREGGSYLQGGAFDRASPVGHFNERIAVAFDSAECHCSGRAVRRLAELHGRSPRTIVRGLPPEAWHYEP